MATALVSAAAFGTAAVSADQPAPPAMKYRMLGNTGLQVSVLGFGFWATYGAKEDLQDQEGINVAKACMRKARQAGVNLFDNAETYGTPRGKAEEIMGEALRQLREEDSQLWRRSELILTTKIFWGFDGGVNEKGLSVKHCREGMDAALKRLQTDYVDLVFCHRPDPLTPTATVVRAMTDLVRSGKATAWGTSEWSAQQITEAYWIAKTEGLEPPQFEQPQYNMFHRQRFEQEYFPLYQAPYNIGTTIWSGLRSGFLTGKYNHGIPKGTRADAMDFIAARIKEWKESGDLDKVVKLEALAKKKGCALASLALAWCLKNPNVSCILLGATKPEQLDDTLLSLQVAKELTPEDMAAIEAILGNKPEDYSGYGGENNWQRTIAAPDF